VKCLQVTSSTIRSKLTKSSGSSYPSHVIRLALALSAANCSFTILELVPGVWTDRTRRLWFVRGGSDAENVTEQLDTVSPTCFSSRSVAEQPGHATGTVAWRKISTYGVLSHISIWYFSSVFAWRDNKCTVDKLFYYDHNYLLFMTVKYY